MELEEAPAGVVEDAVEHDADAPGVGLVDQPPERGVAAQHRVDLLVVVRVIAVVRRRLEDRREVDGVDAQVLTGSRGARRRRSGRRPDSRDRSAAQPQSSRCLGLGTVSAPREPVGEDLVEDRVANPVGRLGDRAPALRRERKRTGIDYAYPSTAPDRHADIATSLGAHSADDPMPVELLPVAAEAQVFEHRFEVELDLSLEARACR